MKMTALWLPGGVTHLRRTEDVGVPLCGRVLGSLCDDADHVFPSPEGRGRTERYCYPCQRLAYELQDREVSRED